MKFLRNKGTNLILVMVSIMCIATVIISVYITVNMYKRYNKLVRIPRKDMAVDVQEDEGVTNASFEVNIKGINEQIFYYNGQKVRGVQAYLHNEKDVLIAFDWLLDKMGTKYSYYNSDDIFETYIDGKKLLLRLDENFLLYGEKKIPLTVAPVAAKGHFLVPADLFNHLDGFKVDSYSRKNIVFMQYFPALKESAMKKVRMLRLRDGMAEITDIEGKGNFWDRERVSRKEEELEFSPDMSMSILKTAKGVYLIENGGNKLPYLIDVDTDCSFSEDSNYLYWVDKELKTSYVYDVRSHRTEELGDYYFRIESNLDDGNPAPYGNLLSEYVKGPDYKRVSLTNAAREGNYSFIERNGEVVIEGKFLYSPDKNRVIFYKKGRGYFTVRADGLGIVFLGKAFEAAWVNNDKIILHTSKGKFVFDRYGTNKQAANNNWRFLGQARNGDLFYTDGLNLYSKDKGIGTPQEKVAELPGECSYIYALTGKGPIIMATGDSSDGVFCLSGNRWIKVGKASLLFKDQSEKDTYVNYIGSITLSPDSRYCAVFQRGLDFITVNFIDTKTLKNKKVVLNYNTNGQTYLEPIKFKWISNGRLLVHTALRGWVIDCSGPVQIYQWDEKKGSIIETIIK